MSLPRNKPCLCILPPLPTRVQHAGTTWFTLNERVDLFQDGEASSQVHQYGATGVTFQRDERPAFELEWAIDSFTVTTKKNVERAFFSCSTDCDTVNIRCIVVTGTTVQGG